MSKINYDNWYKKGDENIYCRYLVEGYTKDRITKTNLKAMKEFDSLEDYDYETNDLEECEAQEWFTSIKAAKDYIKEKFQDNTLIKAYIYDELEGDGETIFGDVYNEDWFDKVIKNN